MPSRRLLIVAVLVAVGAAGVGLTSAARSPYELQVAMPTASGLFDGAHVVMAGEQVGEVTDVGVEGNTAVVTIELDDEHTPVPAGTQARISWQSLLGYRTLELVPGAEENPSLPSGQRIHSATERVELDDVLATLDKPTRHELQGLIKELDQTLENRGSDVNRTLRTAGPTVQALGEVLHAVGRDGPAIRKLVARLHDVTAQIASRDAELSQVVDDLHVVSAASAKEERAVSQALAELPSTLKQANVTLDRVPPAVDATAPLLIRLRPATRRLPGVARQLDPVLRDLQPTLADLRPMLASADRLLDRTPQLLDSAHAVLPDLTDTVQRLSPAVAFLRPYSPELVGWLSNWTSLFGSQTPDGNFGRALILEGTTSFNENPGVIPPGIKREQEPSPGAIVGQPWTDANGDGMR